MKLRGIFDIVMGSARWLGVIWGETVNKILGGMFFFGFAGSLLTLGVKGV